MEGEWVSAPNELCPVLGIVKFQLLVRIHALYCVCDHISLVKVILCTQLDNLKGRDFLENISVVERIILQ